MSLVLYNPLQGTRAHIPELPEYWVHVHQSASAASVATGAFTYAFSHMLGSAATRITSGTISIAGFLMANGVRYVAGDEAADKVYRGSQTVANLVTTTGETATQVVSAVSSTATAATVGSTFLVGKMLHEIYMGIRQKEDQIVEHTEHKDGDFIIYDITNTTSPDSSSSSEPSEQTQPPQEDTEASAPL